MWVRLVVGLSLGMGLLWTALLIQNLLSPEPNAQYALAEAAFAFFFVEIFFVTRAARLENERFLKWLAANAGAIREEGVEYEGKLITPATVGSTDRSNHLFVALRLVGYSLGPGLHRPSYR